MTNGDLHSALKTEVVSTRDTAGVRFALARLQHSKDSITYSLHAEPHTWSTSGYQTSDLVALLGFRRQQCAFVQGNEGYCRSVPSDFDLDAFSKAFAACKTDIETAAKNLEQCGIFLDQPEGWGYFHGKPSGGRTFTSGGGGDGHTSPASKRMKESADDKFRYVFTWIEGGRDKGWTTHYRPQHPPLSLEMQAAFSFLGLRSFQSCPEFDFEPCWWRFTPFEQRGDTFFDGNADSAHRWFDSHQGSFAPGLAHLLSADLAVRPYGMGFLRISAPAAIPASPGAARVITTTAAGKTKRVRERPYTYDVAISFAGPERHLAEQLATIVRDAGFEVFYDDFYEEQLWGKDLVVSLDNVYRKESQYCVILISHEYRERMWTNHERRSAQARALEERGREYILPIKVQDDAELDGMPPTVKHLSLSRYSIEQVAEMLLKKLRG